MKPRPGLRVLAPTIVAPGCGLYLASSLAFSMLCYARLVRRPDPFLTIRLNPASELLVAWTCFLAVFAPASTFLIALPPSLGFSLRPQVKR